LTWKTCFRGIVSLILGKNNTKKTVSLLTLFIIWSSVFSLIISSGTIGFIFNGPASVFAQAKKRQPLPGTTEPIGGRTSPVGPRGGPIGGVISPPATESETNVEGKILFSLQVLVVRCVSIWSRREPTTTISKFDYYTSSEDLYANNRVPF
jgi:hypothetical protein